jgi:hypothetical protein
MNELEYEQRAREAGVPEAVIQEDLRWLRDGWWPPRRLHGPCRWPVPLDLATGACARCGWHHAPRSRAYGALVDAPGYVGEG